MPNMMAFARDWRCTKDQPRSEESMTNQFRPRNGAGTEMPLVQIPDYLGVIVLICGD
jgi:hypothetical protein